MTPTTHHFIEHSLEQSLDSCIKCNICTVACPVSAVTDLFPGPKYAGPQAQRFRNPNQPSPDTSVDYCSGCHICDQVCPAGVRIAELNARARARMVAQRGMRLSNRLLGHVDILSRLGCGPQAPIVNGILRSRTFRSALEYLTNIDHEAPLPPFAPSTFRSWFTRRGVRDSPAHIRSNNRRQVVYFHGCTTNYHEPWVGQAAVAVLERNGFEVIVAKQHCCGMPLLSNGDFAAARRYHKRNITHLLPYAHRGIPIVGTSPSCTLVLKEEALQLLGMHDADTRKVAEHTYDIFEFLRLLYERGALCTDFQPLELTLPYHPPCQLGAHRIGYPARDILELIPRLSLRESNHDCCGIAGTYGLKCGKYQIALDVGAALFAFVQQQGSNLVLCDSEVCRWQITHATGLASRHPIELLHRAYR